MDLQQYQVGGACATTMRLFRNLQKNDHLLGIKNAVSHTCYFKIFCYIHSLHSHNNEHFPILQMVDIRPNQIMRFAKASH